MEVWKIIFLSNLKNMESNLSHIIHMYRPFLSGCSFDDRLIFGSSKKECYHLHFADQPILVVISRNRSRIYNNRFLNAGS